MDIENDTQPACSECGAGHVVLVKLIDVLDKLGVEYTIEPHIAA